MHQERLSPGTALQPLLREQPPLPSRLLCRSGAAAAAPPVAAAQPQDPAAEPPPRLSASLESALLRLIAAHATRATATA